MAVALLGEQTHFSGLARVAVYRWFTDPRERALYPSRDHAYQSSQQVAQLRARLSRSGSGSPAGKVVERLLRVSDEFAEIWARHEVASRSRSVRRWSIPNSARSTSIANFCWRRARVRFC